MSNDNYIRYVILLNHVLEKPFTEEIVRAHIAHLKRLDENEQLILCGPFKEYEGGMIVIKASSLDEATLIAEADPFIKEGYETYEIRILELSCEENNHIGMG